jgi:hypothetical protein
MVWPIIAYAGSKVAGGLYDKANKGSKASGVAAHLLDPAGLLDPGKTGTVDFNADYGKTWHGAAGQDYGQQYNNALASTAQAGNTAWDASTEAQYRQASAEQQAMLSGLQKTAETGEGAATENLRKMYERMGNQQTSAMAGNRSLSAGEKARMGYQSKDAMSVQQGQQEAIVREQAKAQARQLLSRLAAQARQQDQQYALNQAQQQQQLGMFNAQQLSQMYGGMMSLDQQRQILNAQASQQLGTEYDKMMLQKQLAEAGMYNASNQSSVAANRSFLGGLLGGLSG